MRAKPIKSVFREFWWIVCIELESLYSSLHWESIIENVAKMIDCGEFCNGFAEYICPYGIFDVTHRHLVFILPEELRKIVFDNRQFIKTMMDCASKTAMEVLQSRGSDAVPGILSIVHTFGRNIKLSVQKPE